MVPNDTRDTEGLRVEETVWVRFWLRARIAYRPHVGRIAIAITDGRNGISKRSGGDARHAREMVGAALTNSYVSETDLSSCERRGAGLDCLWLPHQYR